MSKVSDFYIDLGTANTLVYAKGHGFKINEPTILTVKQKDEQYIEHSAFGQKAKIMLGKTPLSMVSLRPLKEGVISNFEYTFKLIEYFIRTVEGRNRLRKSRLIISLPCQVTQHEKLAIEELGKNLGARQVDLISEPIAAAIGAGFNVLDSKGKMIVDLGGGTSEAAIISLGGIVASQAKRIGGVSLDEAIIDHLKFKYQFYIGEQTAERLKMLVGSAMSNPIRPKGCEVGGIDLKSGLPRKLTVTSAMIFQPIDLFVREIVSVVEKTFEECPPEISGDLAECGILLAGGGALLGELPERLVQELGVKVKVSTNPLLSVSIGGAKALEDNGLFDRLQAG